LLRVLDTALTKSAAIDEYLEEEALT
jgi:hypothetical protein